ncbi:uncharacterized protein LOC144544415 [Carex rostrata]
MRDDKWEMMLSWCFSKDLIENSPSRHDGISADVEEQTRSQYCQFIRWMCSQFKLDTIPTATALMFCHRFYALQSLAKNDWKTIATACVFLSSKSENMFRALDDIVKIAFANDVQKLPIDSEQKEFLQKKRELIEMAERVVLINLRFDTNVNHPYRPLHDAMKKLGINSKELRREVWKLVCCWLDSTLCLEHTPEGIAAASIHILNKLYDLKLPDIRGLSLWSEKFAPEQLDECIRQMVQILCKRKWPQCAKLTDRPALPQPEPMPKPEPEPEPKLKQATPIQNLPEPELGPEENNPKSVTPDSVLDLAVPKRDTIVLDSSSLSEDASEQKAPETKQEGLRKGVLDKAYVARIRVAIMKRKSKAEVSRTVGNTQLEASSGGMDDWIERELESGIIVGSKPVCNMKKAEQKTDAILLDTSSENADLWIEKELEEGIIIESKPVNHNKMKRPGESGAALKLEKYNASKAWRGLKREREREAGADVSSKRQWKSCTTSNALK